MSRSREQPERPSVMLVLVHDAGRSQMAGRFLTSLSGEAIRVGSAGTLLGLYGGGVLRGQRATLGREAGDPASGVVST